MPTSGEKEDITPEDEKRADKRRKEKKKQKECTGLKGAYEAELAKLNVLKDDLKKLQKEYDIWFKWRTDSLGELKGLASNAADRAPGSHDYAWLKPSEALGFSVGWFSWLNTTSAMPFFLQNKSGFGNTAFIENYYDLGTTKMQNTKDAIKKKKEAITTQENVVKAALKEYQETCGVNGPFPYEIDPSAPDTGDGGGGGAGDKPISAKDAKKIKYKYNIPMVKSAYYQKGLEHLQMTLVNNANWTVKDNGRKMWLGQGGGKGVIQADAQYANSQKNKEWRDFYGGKVKKQELYGMRFLYNPMTVNMGWGVVQQVDPWFEATGQDKAVALAPSLLQSTIQFSLMLNRIEDMNHIDENGWRTGSRVTSEQVGEELISTNPWPTKELPTAYNDDLKEIYKRGTMYDLEHLLASVMPAQPRFWSTLNGYTADWGWLSGYACELHLGDGLRYRVRITNLSVDHIVFNERMVPVLSEVNITMNRYPDIRSGTTLPGAEAAK